MSHESFDAVVTTESELRELYRLPNESTVRKKLGALDMHARGFIEASPFMLIGTVSLDGTADVSPKGGPPAPSPAIRSPDSSSRTAARWMARSRS